jgi:hypothetical protein
MDWCWVWLPELDPLFAKPSTLLVSKAEWQETDPRDSELAAAVEPIRKLRNQGIMARHVITSFLWEQVAPLSAMTTQCGHSQASEIPPGSGRAAWTKQSWVSASTTYFAEPWEHYVSVFWIPGILVHLLLGHSNVPASAWEHNEDRTQQGRPS